MLQQDWHDPGRAILNELEPRWWLEEGSQPNDSEQWLLYSRNSPNHPFTIIFLRKKEERKNKFLESIKDQTVTQIEPGWIVVPRNIKKRFNISTTFPFLSPLFLVHLREINMRHTDFREKAIKYGSKNQETTLEKTAPKYGGWPRANSHWIWVVCHTKPTLVRRLRNGQLCNLRRAKKTCERQNISSTS